MLWLPLVLSASHNLVLYPKRRNQQKMQEWRTCFGSSEFLTSTEILGRCDSNLTLQYTMASSTGLLQSHDHHNYSCRLSNSFLIFFISSSFIFCSEKYSDTTLITILTVFSSSSAYLSYPIFFCSSGSCEVFLPVYVYSNTSFA